MNWGGGSLNFRGRWYFEVLDSKCEVFAFHFVQRNHRL